MKRFRAAVRRMREESAGTSLLKSKKINFGSSPIVNNNAICSSHSSSALVQSSLSSSVTSSSTSQESYIFDDDMKFDVDMFSLTGDLEDNVVNLEEETSPHTSSIAYHSGSSNSIVSITSTSAAIINTTSDSSSTTTRSSCTVVPMKEYNFLHQNHSSSIVGDHQFLISSNVVDSTGGLSITQNVQPPTEVRLNEP